MKILTRLTLGKYCTGTDGVVELRNLSRLPASSVGGGGAGAGAGATAASAAAFADGLEGASGRLSASFGGGAAGSAAPAGGGFCLEALGVSATAAGDEGRWPLSRWSCSSCCCWRRTWGGL